MSGPRPRGDSGLAMVPRSSKSPASYLPPPPPPAADQQPPVTRPPGAAASQAPVRLSGRLSAGVVGGRCGECPLPPLRYKTPAPVPERPRRKRRAAAGAAASCSGGECGAAARAGRRLCGAGSAGASERLGQSRAKLSGGCRCGRGMGPRRALGPPASPRLNGGFAGRGLKGRKLEPACLTPRRASTGRRSGGATGRESVGRAGPLVRHVGDLAGPARPGTAPGGWRWAPTRAVLWGEAPGLQSPPPGVASWLEETGPTEGPPPASAPAARPGRRGVQKGKERRKLEPLGKDQWPPQGGHFSPPGCFPPRAGPDLPAGRGGGE